MTAVLRGLIVTFGTVAFGAGAAVVLFGHSAWPVGVELMVVGLLFFVGTVWERIYYRRVRTTKRAGFETTEERFIDPVDGTPIVVDYNPASGEREYRKI